MRGVRIVSASMGLCALLIAVVHMGPVEWARRPLPSGQVSVVTAIESLGPVWPVLFTCIGVAILATTRFRRGVVFSHGIAAAGWVFYGLTHLTGAAMSEPPSPLLTGGIALFVAAMHYGCARAWAEMGFR